MNYIALILFPLFILTVDIVMQGGTLTGQTIPVCFGQTTVGCTQNNNSVTYSCPTSKINQPCDMGRTCKPALPAPAFCLGPTFVYPDGEEYLPAGATMVLSVTQASGQGILNFGQIGISGLIPMITVAVAVAVLSGLTILGSGLNTASIRILFIAGLILGIWFFFSGLDGFLSGSNASVFTALNNASTTWSILPLGTIFWVVLTLLETVGTITYLSRGGE